MAPCSPPLRPGCGCRRRNYSNVAGPWTHPGRVRHHMNNFSVYKCRLERLLMPFLVFYWLYNPVRSGFLPHNWERKSCRGSPAVGPAANKVFQQTVLQAMGRRAYYKGFQYRQLSFFLLILTSATAESAKHSEGSGDPTLDPTLSDILRIHRLSFFFHEGMKNFSQHLDPSSATPRSPRFWKSQRRYQDTFAISLLAAAVAVIFLVLVCHQVHQKRPSSAAAARRLGDDGNHFPPNCHVSRLTGMSSSHTTGPSTCSKEGGDVPLTGCGRYRNYTTSRSSSTIGTEAHQAMCSIEFEVCTLVSTTT